MKRWAILIACMACVDWTRFAGTVKSVNLKESTVTIQNKDGDLFTVPVDYQVQVIDKGGDLRGLKDLRIDQRITLMRTLQDKPATEDSGMPQPDWDNLKKGR